jgi:hypothetical protein
VLMVFRACALCLMYALPSCMFPLRRAWTLIAYVTFLCQSSIKSVDLKTFGLVKEGNMRIIVTAASSNSNH